MRILFLLVFWVFSARVQAETEDFVVKNRPFTLSIFGPISTNLGAYDETNNYICLGLINCSSYSIQGFSYAYGFNITSQSMDGFVFGLLGNYAGGDAKGVIMGYFGNYAGGNLKGVQFGVMNWTMGAAAGSQMGLVNVIGGDEKSQAVSVPFGFLNVSLQPRTFPVGLVNIVRGGRLSLDLNRDPFGLARLLVLTGSRYLYTIYSLDNKGLNPDHKRYMHPSSMTGYGIGGAVPLDEELAVRGEFLYYAPSGYAADAGNEGRLLLEWSKSIVTLYGGIDLFRFRNAWTGRYQHFGDEEESQHTFSVGATLNLLGWWR